MITLPQKRDEVHRAITLNFCDFCRNDVEFVKAPDGFYIGCPTGCPRDFPCVVRVTVLLRVLQSEEYQVDAA